MMKAVATAADAVERDQRKTQVQPLYLEALTLVERLHRRLLDVIKDEFDRRGRSDINSVQALLLYNIGDKELTAGELRTRGYYLGSNVSYNLKKLVEMGFLDHQRSRVDRRGRSDINSVQALLLYNIGDKELTAGELRTRGYYLGSNVSYNLKKLVEMGFLDHQRSRVDRRSVRIRLTAKGQEVRHIVEALYDKHVKTVEQVGGISNEEFATLNKSLHRLERFWTDQILYRL